jgi:hypothetical protein
VVFQRFRSDGIEPGVHVIPRAADLESVYHEGRFGPIHLSVGGLPQHETDWRFLERHTADLIRVDPGASAPGRIELSEIHRQGESDAVQAVFEELDHEIASHSHKGVRGGSHSYPGFYWTEDVRSLALYRKLGAEASRFTLPE